MGKLRWPLAVFFSKSLIFGIKAIYFTLKPFVFAFEPFVFAFEFFDHFFQNRLVLFVQVFDFLPRFFVLMCHNHVPLLFYRLWHAYTRDQS